MGFFLHDLSQEEQKMKVTTCAQLAVSCEGNVWSANTCKGSTQRATADVNEDVLCHLPLVISAELLLLDVCAPKSAAFCLEGK